ncbi:hypothetical protein B0H13DRAFT_2154120 [Mycena leptocephala]|nr:hypothetical protein B0H13DRAFT_2154120 [Mycena leptocephala]
MLSKIRVTAPRQNAARNSGSPNLDAKTRPLGLVVQFLNETECSPSLRSLELFGCLQPNIHLGLVYNELHDIKFYWDSLSPVEKAIAKHRFFLEYVDATSFSVIDAIFWIGGRSSHVVFPRPSPPTSKLLTLVNTAGSLQIFIVPDGEHPIYYPHTPHTESVNRDTISWLESEVRKPSANISPPILRSLALAVYRTIMVASAGGTIVSRRPEPTNVLGELVIRNSERPFWMSDVQFRHHLPALSFADKSYKWTWYDNTKKDIYHGIPGWTRFVLICAVRIELMS